MQSFSLIQRRTQSLTLIQTLLLLTIGGLVVGGLTSLFVMQPRFSEAQDDTRAMVQNAHLALEAITQDLRMAGYNPTGANFDGITYAPMHLHIRADLNGDGLTDAPNEDIRYIYDAEQQQIIRADCTGQEPLAEHIQAFALTGLDAAGKPTTIGAHVRQLRITVTASAAAGDVPAAPQYRPRTYTLTTFVHLRNISSTKEYGRG